MNGRAHALSGTFVFGGATLAFHFDVPELVFGVIFTTGAALYPDLDHHNATMTKSCGPLSWVVNKIFGLIFGGHRNGTHSIFFAVLMAIGAQVALDYRHTIAGGTALSIMMALAFASLVRLFAIKGWIDDLLAIAVCPVIVFLTDIDLHMVPGALGFGCLIHVLGDCLTDRGCPVLWPVSRKKWTLDLFTTGKLGEKITVLIMIVGIVLTIVTHVYRGISA